MARKKSLDQHMLRPQILDEASRLFYERGFAATSIRDIADAVGISSSTLYHHFANKQEVLSAIVTRFMTDFNNATIPVLEDRTRTPTERLLQVLATHIEMSDDRRPELLVGNPVLYALDVSQRDRVLKQEAEYHAAVRAVIDEGQQRGIFSVADPGLATMALLDMINGVREWYNAAGRVDRETLVRRYQEFTLRILGVGERSVPDGDHVGTSVNAHCA
ncbi:TetR family transcriptional regulator [Nocardia tenerifensis]|uniref:TetR family transcriptional regulator n=1 Tax=Nocardia tenerifensis TaxID=228006 RepID=A0A318JXF1_9NOCA|nr:TetR/AcrR family transcriptional regulator [Nocardia tenerifensis]PXX58431.1 TetR family transcriptional regulator [Nocardia tenerifensis]